MAEQRAAARPRTLEPLSAVANRPGLSFRLLIGPPDGVRDVFLAEARLESGATVASHEHEVTEAIVVLEGALTLRVGDGTLEISAGQSFAFPVGVPHAVEIRGAVPARFLATAGWDHDRYAEATTYLSR
jgi:quercetin dioxygenase-like cupin family protein